MNSLPGMHVWGAVPAIAWRAASDIPRILLAPSYYMRRIRKPRSTSSEEILVELSKYFVEAPQKESTANTAVRKSTYRW